MKKFTNLSTLLFVLAIFILTNCTPKPDHSVRIKNDTAIDFEEAKIGPSAFGTVAKGSTSGYKTLPEGSSAITGYFTAQGQQYPVTGSTSISGNGKHKWTVTIDKNLNFSMAEDK